MHGAPSVTYPVGRSFWGAALPAGLWLLGAAALWAWGWQSGSWSWRQGLGVLVLLAAGLSAARAWAAAPVGELRWDGQAWYWSAAPGEGSGALRVSVDLQSRMLVCWRPGRGPGSWLWLERARLPARWIDLRRAVYSPASTDALPTGGPPAAIP